MQDENGLHDHLITLQQLQNLPHFDFDRLACVCVGCFRFHYSFHKN